MNEDNITPIEDGDEDADNNVMEKLYNEAEAALDAQDAAQDAVQEDETNMQKIDDQNMDTAATDATAPPPGVPGQNTASQSQAGAAPAVESKQEDLLIVALKEEVEKNRAGWQRALADFQNYKRRTERELGDSRQRAALDTLTSVLPVIDDFERALANVPDDLAGHSWMNGVELILNKLNKLLDEHNVSIIDPVGEVFDPTRHEAIGTDDSDETESGHVTATLQKGYAADGRILRPALVRVAS